MATRMTLASVGKQVVLYTTYADTVRAPYTGSGERDERWQASGGKCNNEHVAQSGWMLVLQRHEGAMMIDKGRTGSLLAWIEGNNDEA